MRQLLRALALLFLCVGVADAQMPGAFQPLNLGGGGSSGTPPTLTYNTGLSTTTAGGTVVTGTTYSAVAISTAAANRTVIVAVTLRTPGTCNMTGVTIGGITAAQAAHSQNSGGSGSTTVDIWTATVPTGTTANIVVTYCASTDHADGIGVWSAYGLTSNTPTGTATSSSTTVFSLNVNTQTDGIVIAAAWTFTPVTNPICAWSGVTNKFDLLTDPAGAQRMNGASASGVVGALPLTVACTENGTSGFEPAAVAAAFR